MRGERVGRRLAGACGGSLRVLAAALAVPRAVKAAVALLATAGLLLSVQGCGGTASAATASGGLTRTSGLTPAAAMRVFDSYVTAEHVALADRSELLALSLVTNGAYDLTVASFHIAGHGPLPAYDYGKPTLYVPKLSTYPYWFMAAVSRTPASSGRGASARPVVLVFDKSDADAQWTLDGTVALPPGTPPLPVAVGSSGYATPLPTFDQALKATPNVVGALQAAVVDGGPASPSAAVVAAGPQTTGMYRTYSAAAHQATALQETYQWELDGVHDPVFTLRTTDGGGLVYYTMHLDTLAQISSAAARSHGHRSPVSPIPIPPAFRPLLPLHQPPVHHELATEQTLQYLALVPPASAHAAKIQVIGVGGGPTSASAH